MGEASVSLPLTLHYMSNPPIVIAAQLCRGSRLGLSGADPVHQVVRGAMHDLSAFRALAEVSTAEDESVWHRAPDTSQRMTLH